MITRTIHIKGWKAHFYFSIHDYWKDEILNKLQHLGASKKILRKVSINMSKNKMNTGFTFSKPNKRESIVVIGRSSDGGEFLNSCTHEIRHLVDDIAKEYRMEICGEEVAYLTGDIINLIADIVCKFSCNCCRHGKGSHKHDN